MIGFGFQPGHRGAADVLDSGVGKRSPQPGCLFGGKLAPPRIRRRQRHGLVQQRLLHRLRVVEGRQRRRLLRFLLLRPLPRPSEVGRDGPRPRRSARGRARRR